MISSQFPSAQLRAAWEEDAMAPLAESRSEGELGHILSESGTHDVIAQTLAIFVFQEWIERNTLAVHTDRMS